MATHALAPMTTDLKVMTGVALVLPGLLAAAFFALPGGGAPPVLEAIKLGALAFVVLIYAVIFVGFRPTAFELDSSGLVIRWPIRSRVIAREALIGATVTEARAFREKYGLGMRIGAGGFFGGFGLLKTGAATFSMWISRTDAFVIVELKDARPLLITPERPDEFVTALRRMVG